MIHVHGGSGTAAGLLVLGPAVAVAGLAAYLLAVRRLRGRGDRWPGARCAAAALAAATVALALLPVHAAGFRGHVQQHLLLVVLAPALAALGAPATLALRTLPRAGRRVLLAVLHSRWVRVVTSAPAVVLLAAGGTWVHYATPVFALAQREPWVQALAHTHMVAAGCLLAWFLLGPDPLPHRPRLRTRLLVLLLVAASHDVLAKVLYAHGLPVPAQDPAQVRAGAVLMFYGGEAVDVLLAVAVMAQWYRRTGRRWRHRTRHAACTPITGRQREPVGGDQLDNDQDADAWAGPAAGTRRA